MLEVFRTVEEKDKNAAIESIIQHASPRRDFFMMVMLAVSMAAFGVLLDSPVVIIGSMLIAPILYPILSLALGFTLADEKLIARSGFTLFKSVVFAIAAGFVIAFFFRSNIDGLSVIKSVAAGQPSLIYAIIAGISGFAAAFAVVKPDLNEMLPGVAISVSLVPPLAIVGVALARLEFSVAANAFLLFLVNVVGIVLCAMLVFSMLQLARKQKVVTQAVQKDEAAIIAEKEEAKKPVA